MRSIEFRTSKAEMDALTGLQADTNVELNALLSATLDRARTHSSPTHSGFAISLCEMLLTRSQLARIKGEL